MRHDAPKAVYVDDAGRERSWQFLASSSLPKVTRTLVRNRTAAVARTDYAEDAGLGDIKGGGSPEDIEMRHQMGDTYALGFRAVQDRTPGSSGIYAIFTPQRWLRISESDDIRRSLLDFLNGSDANGLAESGALSFSFEVVPAAGRVARRRALVAQLAPGLGDDHER